jgi:hypothetical protein
MGHIVNINNLSVGHKTIKESLNEENQIFCSGNVGNSAGIGSGSGWL